MRNLCWSKTATPREYHDLHRHRHGRAKQNPSKSIQRQTETVYLWIGVWFWWRCSHPQNAVFSFVAHISSLSRQDQSDAQKREKKGNAVCNTNGNHKTKHLAVVYVDPFL